MIVPANDHQGPSDHGGGKLYAASHGLGAWLLKLGNDEHR